MNFGEAPARTEPLCFVMVAGYELVGSAGWTVKDGAKGWELQKPRRIVMIQTQRGMANALAPISTNVEEGLQDQTIFIREVDVLSHGRPVKPLLDAYLQQTIGLVMA
jgi:hypothetical protein